MDDKTKFSFIINDSSSSFRNYLCKKFKDEMDKLPVTEKSIEKVIKNDNEVVAYHIEEKSIFLYFYDGLDSIRIEFYIDDKGNIQARLKA